jgi:hypothetical protein
MGKHKKNKKRKRQEHDQHGEKAGQLSDSKLEAAAPASNGTAAGPKGDTSNGNDDLSSNVKLGVHGVVAEGGQKTRKKKKKSRRRNKDVPYLPNTSDQGDGTNTPTIVDSGQKHSSATKDPTQSTFQMLFCVRVSECVSVYCCKIGCCWLVGWLHSTIRSRTEHIAVIHALVFGQNSC